MADDAEQSNTANSLLQNFQLNDAFQVKNISQLGGWSNAGYTFLVETNGAKVVLRCMSKISLKDAIYVTEFSEWMSKNGIPIPALYPLKICQNGNRFVHQTAENKSYVLENFMEGKVLEMHTRANPSHPEFPRVLEYYRSIGIIAAKINNVALEFRPSYMRTFPSRESVVESMKIDHFHSLNAGLASRGELNSCEKFFQENFQEIVNQFSKQVNWFKGYWKPEKQVRAHVHNDLHFQNVIFRAENTEIVAVIDWERAQFDCRVVEFNNIIMALIDASDKIRERLFYDVGDIISVFVCTVTAYQENVTLKLSPEEIVGAWEVVRARALETFWKNFDPNLSYFAFNYPSRVAVLKNHLEMIQKFPEHPPSSVMNLI